MNNKKRQRLSLSILLCLILQNQLLALPSDNQAKMIVSSDTAEVNRLTGIGIYTGNVVITRGTTHITAKKLTTYNDKQDQITKAIALGDKHKRAEYRTLTEEDKPILIAKANTITYFPQKHYVILTGNAAVSQGMDTITGPHLEYDLNKQILITKTDTNAKATSQRTTIIIQPGELSDSDSTKKKE